MIDNDGNAAARQDVAMIRIAAPAVAANIGEGVPEPLSIE